MKLDAALRSVYIILIITAKITYLRTFHKISNTDHKILNTTSSNSQRITQLNLTYLTDAMQLYGIYRVFATFSPIGNMHNVTSNVA